MGTGETTRWPAIRTAVNTEQSVLLFKAEPWSMFFNLFHDLGCVMTVIGLVRCTVIVESLCED